MRGLALIAVLWASPLLSQSPDYGVRGTIRDGDTAEPVAGALVELPAAIRYTVTDSAGTYVLSGLGPGAQSLRVSRLGFESRAVTLYVGGDPIVQLDITLKVLPMALERVAVVGLGRRAGIRRNTGRLDARAEAGLRMFSEGDLKANPALADADVLQVLTTVPDVAAMPEAPTSLHIHGGSAAENAILLDGVPVFNPYHAAGSLTALDPDIVASVTLHAGVPPARYGDAASSVIAIRTAQPERDRISARGGLGPSSIRQSVSGRLQGSNATFVLAGRRSVRDALAIAGNVGNTAGNFTDWFAKTTIGREDRGTLEFFSFASRDQIAFDAGVGTEQSPPAPATGTDMFRVSGHSADAAAPSRNTMGWTTATQAIIGHRGAGRGPHWEARAWHTQFSALAEWAAIGGLLNVASALREIGGEVVGSWQIAAAQLTAGGGTRALRTRYDVSGPAGATIPGSNLPRLVLDGSPVLVSGFIDGSWAPTNTLALTAGLRQETAFGHPMGIEPRLSAGLAFAPGFTVTAGYARLHQPVQSLRNEESVLDGLYGITLPAAIGADGVPVARSDQITTGLEARIDARTTLSLDAYGRKMSGELLVAPTTAQPFAVAGVAAGAGTAEGLALRLSFVDDRVIAHAGYALSQTTRRAAGGPYRPSFGAIHAATVALGYRLTEATTIRVATDARSQRPASIVLDELQWTSPALLRGPGEIAGSPQRREGALNAGRLAPYFRVDVGLRHEWRVAAGDRSTLIAGALNVSNVLDRSNPFALVRTPSDPNARALSLFPRMLTVGLEWAY
ncbi:MAG: hypothetical protein NVS4B3_03430 [Gemmatimonadaceae bacterium]